MTSLYELTVQQQELKEIAGNGDLPAEAFADTFEALEGEFNQKAVATIHVIHDIDSDLEKVEVEIKRLTARKNVIKNKKESIREYLRSNMEANDITRIMCPLFTITLAKGRDVCVIDDEGAIPDEYVEVSVVTKPNKAEILKQLKAGNDIPGARIEKSQTSLRIK